MSAKHTEKRFKIKARPRRDGKRVSVAQVYADAMKRYPKVLEYLGR